MVTDVLESVEEDGGELLCGKELVRRVVMCGAGLLRRVMMWRGAERSKEEKEVPNGRA